MDSSIFGLPGQPTVWAYVFFFLSMLVGCSGSIWVKRHAKCTQDVHNSTHSFNLLLVLFETFFFLVASVIVAMVNVNTYASGAFTWDAATIVCAIVRAVAYVLGMVGYLMAVRHGPLLLTVVICRVGLAIPILLSAMIWPEDNKIRWYMAIGMILLFVALVLFNKKEGTGQPLSKTTPTFWFWAITGAVGNGMEGFTMKWLNYWYPSIVLEKNPGVDPASIVAPIENCLFYASVLQVIFFGIIMFVNLPVKTGIDENGVAIPATERPKYSLRALLAVTFLGGGWILGYAITNATSFYTSSLTISYLPVVFYFMANTGFSILFAFLIARFIFREKLRTQQYIGVVVAVVGMILLNNWDNVLIEWGWMEAPVAAVSRFLSSL